VAGAFFEDGELPALKIGIALIHAQEVASEQRRLVAAGAGPDFEDCVLLVRLVAGEQQDADRMLHLVEFFLDLGDLGFSHLGHFAVWRGRQFLSRAEISEELLIGEDRPDDRLEFRIFLGEAHERIACRTGGELGFDRGETTLERVELVLWKTWHSVSGLGLPALGAGRMVRKAHREASVKALITSSPSGRISSRAYRRGARSGHADSRF